MSNTQRRGRSSSSSRFTNNFCGDFGGCIAELPAEMSNITCRASAASSARFFRFSGFRCFRVGFISCGGCGAFLFRVGLFTLSGRLLAACCCGCGFLLLLFGLFVTSWCCIYSNV